MPKKVRKLRRYPFGQAGTLNISGGRMLANVKIRDISTGGCELEYTSGLNLGKNCELYFDWQQTSFGLQAFPVWRREAQGRAGLQFRKVDREMQRRLNALCNALSQQKPPALRRDGASASAAPETGKTSHEAHPAFPMAAAPKPPSRASRQTRRGVPRYSSDLRGELLNLATGAVSEVTLVELSLSGSRMQGSPLPDPGQQCEVRTEDSGGNQLVLPGEVVWKSEHDLGLKFSPLDEETVRQLRGICRNLTLLPPPSF